MNRCCKLRIDLLLAVVPAVLVVAGCGESNPFSTVPVSGKVTYADGRPIGAAIVLVHFVPDRAESIAGKYPQAGQAELSSDGTFTEASTFGRADGAVPGLHKVVLEAMNADYSPCQAALPEHYTDPSRTPLTVEVQPERENHFVLTVDQGGQP